jgi:hypothetical protein
LKRKDDDDDYPVDSVESSVLHGFSSAGESLRGGVKNSVEKTVNI